MDDRGSATLDRDRLIDCILNTHRLYYEVATPAPRSHSSRWRSHLMKDEPILFPPLRGLGVANPQDRGFHCGSRQNPVRVMVMEHDSAGESLARLRGPIGGYKLLQVACDTWHPFCTGLRDMERDYPRHIHLENNILLRRAVEMEARTFAAAGRRRKSGGRCDAATDCRGKIRRNSQAAEFRYPSPVSGQSGAIRVKV